MKPLTSFHLKIIALLSMIIDHLGMMFFPEYGTFRIVGRIAFILYAFMLVEGYFHTRNIKKYLGKLFLWALISEIPFDLANSSTWFNWEHQNIFWTLFLSALGIHLLEKNKELGIKVLIVSVILFLALMFRVDYNMYGIAIVLSFYFSKKSKIEYHLPILFLSAIYTFLGSKFQIYGLLGLIAIYFYNGRQGRKTGNIYYSFYAVHLLVFVIIKYFYYGF